MARTKKRRRLSGAVWLRRSSQIFFLLLFIGLLVWTQPRPGESHAPVGVDAFFLADPLIALLTFIAARALPLAFLVALVTVLVTVVLGRVFCGWFCPLGTMHALAGRLAERVGLRRTGRGSEKWQPAQRFKYYLLAGLLVMALFGAQWVVLLDPIALAYRSLAVGLLPVLQWAVEDGSTAIYQWNPAVGGFEFTRLSEPVYGFFRDNIFGVPRQGYHFAGAILFFFLCTLALNAWQHRAWCRYVCPLGALLGLLAWRPLLRRKVDESLCNQCDLCGQACHGAAADTPGTSWKPSECLGCMNCTPACAQEGLQFQLAAPWNANAGPAEPVDFSRRGAVGALAGGVAALALMRVSPQARGRSYHPGLIRPPGSGPESEFLARCIGCGLCMKICPTGGLQPTGMQAGLEGLWTPVLVPQVGYCEFDCTLCGQVCPTEAIQSLPLQEKQQTRIGLASFDTGRCLPWAYGRDCIVCEEHCPVPGKAIYFVDAEVEQHDGTRRTVKRPYVEADLCIGCGICEAVCPFRDKAAIRVTSANESRHSENQPILPPMLGGYGDGGGAGGYGGGY